MHNHHYVLYLGSDQNRVYGGAMGAIAAAELHCVVDALHPEAIGPITVAEVGRATTLRFSSSLDHARAGALLGQLSSSLALFSQPAPTTADPHIESAPVLPVPLTEHLRFGADLATTQRYRGKTNEKLTRSMLLVALATAGIDPTNPTGAARPVVVGDPMMGRGTTINWALALGCNAVGIEPDRYALDQHALFISQWAKRRRLPHTMQDYRHANAERRHATFTVAQTRPELKAKEGQQLNTFCADGGDASLPIRRDSLDVIVTDLPYGIRHGNQSAGGAGRPAKWDPKDSLGLLERVTPAWKKWLRPGGSLAFAWNTKRASTDAVRSLLADVGFTPIDLEHDGHSFAHWVDTTIDRDVIVARR